MYRRPVAALLISSAVVLSLTAAALLASTPQEVAVVAAILPLEEEPYSHAKEIESAIMMAIDELNEWGGIGETRIKLVLEEVVQETSAVTAAFEQMEATHHPLFYVTMGCGMLSMLSPLAEATSAPLFGMASALGASEDSSWTYRYFISIPSEVYSIISLMGTLDASSIGILYTTSPHGCSVNESLSEEVAAAGWSVQSAGCPASETDYTDEVSSLLSNEAIYVMTSCELLVGMLEAVKDSGYSGHVISATCGSSPDMREMIPIDPVFMSAPSIYRPENVYALDFSIEFHERYNMSLTHHGGIAYDIVYLAHDILKGKNATRAELGASLDHGFVFSGVMGTIRIDQGVRNFDVPVYPAVVSGGELSYL
ncbi:MAG: ABC transporter substrate-binding protein [Thermoplasmata archaeon]|jgi:ABC-type branched-subunit amino acid transport system substrate-binding protein|nr:ABC transporter substrate-binding protein [Thermoplasmata archaeon]